MVREVCEAHASKKKKWTSDQRNEWQALFAPRSGQYTADGTDPGFQVDLWPRSPRGESELDGPKRLGSRRVTRPPVHSKPLTDTGL